MSAQLDKNNKLKLVYLTSWFWEGSYVLNQLLKHKPDNVEFIILIQEPWWGNNLLTGYTLKYWFKYMIDRTLGVYGNKYYTLQSIIKKHRLKVLMISNINKSTHLLKSLAPDYILVVGSRIIKKKVIGRYRNRIINFHTGYLPNYRGPYSEFWAMYEKQYSKIGTTIHLLDEGIDTGDIMDISKISINNGDTPETAHIKNVREGAKTLAKVIKNLTGKELKGRSQVHSNAMYYSYPKDSQILELEKRLGRKFNIDFVE